MAQTMVNFRMDEELKKNMEAVCADMGLSVTAAFITAFAPAPIMPAGKPSLRKIFPNCVLSVPAG